MKYLFIIQGEGRGHLTQALSLKDMLTANGHEVCAMLVGKSASRTLPDFFKKKAGVPIHQFLSPNFLPTPANKRARLDRSIAYNIIHSPEYIKSIRFIRKAIQTSGADAVINFYELLTGLTYAMFRLSVPYFCIGHQYLFLHKEFEMPPHKRSSMILLNLFTRMTSIGCRQRLALSFREMKKDTTHRITVVPPLLRQDVLHLSPQKGDYILGYMVNAGFAEEVNEFHRKSPQVKMHFFWDKKGREGETYIDPTLSFHQVDDRKFLQRMQECKAYATTAGFESVCEAMYLGKPILMVPAHIEQDCNAYDASKAGAGIVSDHFDIKQLCQFTNRYKTLRSFPAWVHKAEYRILPQLTQQPQEERPRFFSTPHLSAILHKAIFST